MLVKDKNNSIIGIIKIGTIIKELARDSKNIFKTDNIAKLI